MRAEVKDRIIIILAFCLIISFFLNLQLGIQHPSIEIYTPGPQFLVIGVPQGPATLDPIESWESYSYNIIDQVAETLFVYNLSDDNEFTCGIL